MKNFIKSFVSPNFSAELQFNNFQTFELAKFNGFLNEKSTDLEKLIYYYALHKISFTKKNLIKKEILELLEQESLNNNKLLKTNIYIEIEEYKKAKELLEQIKKERKIKFNIEGCYALNKKMNRKINTEYLKLDSTNNITGIKFETDNFVYDFEAQAIDYEVAKVIIAEFYMHFKERYPNENYGYLFNAYHDCINHNQLNYANTKSKNSKIQIENFMHYISSKLNFSSADDILDSSCFIEGEEIDLDLPLIIPYEYQAEQIKQLMNIYMFEEAIKKAEELHDFKSIIKIYAKHDLQKFEETSMQFINFFKTVLSASKEFDTLDSYISNMSKTLDSDNKLFYETLVVDLYNLLGDNLNKTEFFDEGIKFKRNYEGFYFKALHNFRNEEIDACIINCLNSNSVTLNDDSFFMLGCCYLKKGDSTEKNEKSKFEEEILGEDFYAKALDIFKDLEFKKQDDFKINYNLAVAFVKNKREKEATKFFYKSYVLSRRPEILDVLFVTSINANNYDFIQRVFDKLSDEQKNLINSCRNYSSN